MVISYSKFGSFNICEAKILKKREKGSMKRASDFGLSTNLNYLNLLPKEFKIHFISISNVFAPNLEIEFSLYCLSRLILSKLVILVKILKNLGSYLNLRVNFKKLGFNFKSY